ncbi:Broad-complex core protein isoform 6, partial [Operophtera brumata]
VNFAHYEIILSQRGRQLILHNGYTYARLSESKWRCSTNYPECKVYIRGKDMILYKDYTYSEKRPAYWQCSIAPQKKCRARLTLNKNGEITMIEDKHTHPKLQYFVSKAGVFVRCNSR